MRSPNKPGHTPYVPPTPSWVGGTSAEPVTLIGGVERVSGLNISDQHFEGFAGTAINLREYDDVVIERCTFANVGFAVSFQLCTNVTVRDCAYFNLGAEFDGNSCFVQFNVCGPGLVVEDCWGITDYNVGDPEDIISLFKSSGGTVRRNRLFGHGQRSSGAGITLGDGDDPVSGGGDNLLAEDNVLIDCNISAIGTNCTVRNNSVLMRGLVPARDGMSGGIFARKSGSYPDNPFGPHTVENNRVLWYNSTGSLDPGINYDQAQVTVTGILTNPARPLIDEFTAWTPTGYYGWEG